MDTARPHPSHTEAQRVLSTWTTLFHVDAFISEFVSEINQGISFLLIFFYCCIFPVVFYFLFVSEINQSISFLLIFFLVLYFSIGFIRGNNIGDTEFYACKPYFINSSFHFSRVSYALLRVKPYIFLGDTRFTRYA